jgi:CRP-like cAMP-binding protein
MSAATSARRLPLFAEVPPAELDALLRRCPPRRWARGEVVLRQGAPADVALLLLSGRLKAWAEQGGREQPVSDVFPGELVGEAALFTPGAPRTATLRAWEDVEALPLVPEDLRALRGTALLGALQRQMLTVGARRLRTTEHALRRNLAAPPPADAPAAAGLWARMGALLGRLG